MIVGVSSITVTQTSDIAPASRSQFFNIQATIEFEFTLKRVCDMIRTYSQIYELGYCGLESRGSRYKFFK